MYGQSATVSSGSSRTSTHIVPLDRWHFAFESIWFKLDDVSRSYDLGIPCLVLWRLHRESRQKAAPGNTEAGQRVGDLKRVIRPKL